MLSIMLCILLCASVETDYTSHQWQRQQKGLEPFLVVREVDCEHEMQSLTLTSQWLCGWCGQRYELCWHALSS